MALYDFNVGLYRQGSDPIDPKALEEDPLFQKLKVQGKFFRGDLTYSEQEQELLAQWLIANGPAKMHDLLTSRILQWKEWSTRAYPDSDLKRLFDRL